MKKLLSIAVYYYLPADLAQTELQQPGKPGSLVRVKYRLPPSSYKDEIAQMITAQKIWILPAWRRSCTGMQVPGLSLVQYDSYGLLASRYGALANLLLGTAIYDATIAGGYEVCI
jgi:hypothetical protein